MAVITPLPDTVVVRLESPDGSVLEAASGVPTVVPLSAAWLGGLRLTLPALPGVDHAGTWTAVLSLDRKQLAKHKGDDVPDLDALRQRGAVPYSVAVSARSDLELRVRSKHDGRSAVLVAVLDAHGIPFWGGARCHLLVSDPFGRESRLAMDDRGDGRFSVDLPTPDPGVYTVRVMVEGELDGQRFTREQVVTLATVSGEPAEGRPEPDEKVRRRPVPRRRPINLERAIKSAKPPAPLPPPETVEPEVLELFTHGHGLGHFPSEDELPPPVIWETGPEADAARRARKAAARPAGSGRRPAKRTGRSGHGH